MQNMYPSRKKFIMSTVRALCASRNQPSSQVSDMSVFFQSNSSIGGLLQYVIIHTAVSGAYTVRFSGYSRLE